MTSSDAGLKPFLCKTLDSAVVRAEWERWKRAFSIYASANDVVDQTKLKSKLLHLGGLELQDVYFGIPDVDAVDDKDGEGIKVFDIAIQKLDNYFSPKRISVFERHLFRSMKLEEEESFDQFLIRLRKQAEKCSFGDNATESKEINVKDKIIEIAPAELRKKLLEREMSLEDIVNMCKVHAQINAQMEAMKNIKTHTTVQKISQNLQRTGRDQNCFKCNKPGHRAFQCFTNTSLKQNNVQKRPVPKFKCDNCGKSGHTASHCWSVRKRPSVEDKPSHMKRFKPNPIRHIQEQGEDEELSIDERENFILNINEDDEKIVCFVAGMQVKMLIDSGSKYNMIDEVTWCHLQNYHHNLMNIRHTTRKVFKAFASNVPLHVKAVFEAKIKLNNVIEKEDY